jgi:FkbM family methyltransferase
MGAYSGDSKALFDKVRPKDVNLQIAISKNKGSAVLYTFGNPSVWNSLSIEAARAAERKLGISAVEIAVDTTTLEDIFVEHVDPNKFEILMIDAEGLDIDILETAEWGLYKPRIVLVEEHGFDAKNIKADRIFLLMREKGYRFFSFNNPSVVYLREDSMLH